MPRPQKKRTVCRMPVYAGFSPLHHAPQGCVTLTVDELETLRLIDLEGLMQEECAAQMNVSRTTVQSIYAQARHKTADAIVNGRRLQIGGGDYEVCSCRRSGCGHGCHCPRRAAHGTNTQTHKQEEET